MKTLILSTLAAATLAFSAGTALASSNSPDNGFAVYLESVNKAPVARSFLAGEAVYAPTETAPVNFQTDRNGSHH